MSLSLQVVFPAKNLKKPPGSSEAEKLWQGIPTER